MFDFRLNRTLEIRPRRGDDWIPIIFSICKVFESSSSVCRNNILEAYSISYFTKVPTQILTPISISFFLRSSYAHGSIGQSRNNKSRMEFVREVGLKYCDNFTNGDSFDHI